MVCFATPPETTQINAIDLRRGKERSLTSAPLFVVKHTNPTLVDGVDGVALACAFGLVCRKKSRGND